MPDELVHLLKRAFVEQKVYALAGAELALVVLAADPFRASARFGGGVAPADLLHTVDLGLRH
jgi:hypothetical protein